MKQRPLVLLLILILSLGVGVGAAFFPSPVPMSVQSGPGPEEVAVSKRNIDGEKTVQSQATLTDEIPLTMPSSGRITEISCSQGEIWKSGTAPIKLNGQPVLALHTQSPLWRTLEYGSRGDDVFQLQQLLISLDYPVADTGVFDRGTLSAINTMIIEHGGSKVEQFSLEQYLWLPQEQIPITSCQVMVGQDVAIGDPLAISGGALLSLKLPPPIPGEPAELAYSGDVFASIDADGSIFDSSFLSTVSGSARFARWLENPDQPFPVDTRFETSLEVSVIPPASVIALENTSTACVATPEGERKVTVVGSELGQTFVTGELPSTVFLGIKTSTLCK